MFIKVYLKSGLVCLGLKLPNVALQPTRGEIYVVRRFRAMDTTPQQHRCSRAMLKMDPERFILSRKQEAISMFRGVLLPGDVQDHRYRQACGLRPDPGCMAAIDAEKFSVEAHSTPKRSSKNLRRGHNYLRPWSATDRS